MTSALFFAAVYTCQIGCVALVLKDLPDLQDQPDFKSFHVMHGRTYLPGSAEYNMREDIYRRNVEKTRLQNEMPNRRWTAGINSLSDRTEQEYASLLGWRHLGPAKHKASLVENHMSENESWVHIQMAHLLPDKVSWTHLSMAHALPDQGQCGSCWAMAAVTTLTAHSEIAYGKPTHFSAQELVDCVQNPLHCGGKGGCDGATVELAMDWAVFKGLESLSGAPTTDDVARTCKKSPHRASKAEQGNLDADGRLVSMAAVNIQTLVEARSSLSIGLAGYTTLPSNKYMPLLRALALGGPVAVSVDASQWSTYNGGVFDQCHGDLATINHAVVMFGYGTSSQGMYWLIRNSWGSFWGENGYIKLLRTDDEEKTCYTDEEPKQGVSCDGESTPKTVQVCGHCGVLYDSVVPNFVGGNHAASHTTEFLSERTTSHKSVVRGGGKRATSHKTRAKHHVTHPAPSPPREDDDSSSWTKLGDSRSFH